jgi:hypothetical protein
MAATTEYAPRTLNPREPYHSGRAFHKPHTSIGATGHWIRTAGILAPLVIGEFVKDPDQRWRLIRIAAVTTALVSEGMWTHKIRKERQEARELECLAPAAF